MTTQRQGRLGLRLGVVAFLCLGACLASAGETGKPKIAIVVANSRYLELGVLRNPTADGQLVASALRNAGFSVTFLQNVRDEQFRSTLRDIAKSSARVDVTLFYYAGHAAQIGGVNYLLPIDVPRPEQEDDIRLASISADDVLSVIKSPYKVVVLDACRDNPVLGRALSRGRGAGYKHGLAPISPSSEASGGIFIAYSTQTDAVAIDGDGANSPFAESFAKYADTPASIDDMFAMVTRDVLKKTNGFQRPFKYASLDTVFCLAGCPTGSRLETSATEARPSHAIAGSVRDAFVSLNSAKSVEERTQLEDRLTRQLLDALPKVISYGWIITPEGKHEVYGFEPGSVVRDGHRFSTRVRTGEFKDGEVLYDESSSVKYSLDCDNHTMVRLESESQGSVKLFTRAEQRAEAEANTNKPGTIAASLERILCTTPIRLMPLWAVDEVQWVAIGVATPPGTSSTISYAAAPGVAYQDTSNNAHRYVLIRWTGAVQDDAYGTVTRYSWMETECESKRFRLDGTIALTKKGVAVSFFGNEFPWATDINDGSPAMNAQVLLCDQP